METIKKRKKVQVVITFKSEVLLLLLSKDRGHFWQNVTGGVDPGEDYHDAAIRELKEETDLEPSELIELPLCFKYRDRFDYDVTEKVFWATIPKKKNPIISSEHENFKWVKINEITKDDYKFISNFSPLELIKEKMHGL